MAIEISTQLLIDALAYYRQHGFMPIDVPLVIEDKYAKITAPPGVELLRHSGNMVYNASAEQSFISMIDKGELPPGRFMAVTPCHRFEPALDDLHFLIFLKLELIIFSGLERDLRECLDLCLGFFSKYHPGSKIINLDDGSYDIINNDGVELGSYGIRRNQYVYGTGLALPRATI